MERSFSVDEYARMSGGFVPEQMEDKWFIFVEDDVLYAHRSWTGYCIYEMALVKGEGGYSVGEAYANREVSQYSGTDDMYDSRLLLFLVEHLLLGANYPLPIPATVPAGIATELQHHHILGAGQRAEKDVINLSIKGMLGWLWSWVRAMVRR